jgi:hypothetical protein
LQGNFIDVVMIDGKTGWPPLSAAWLLSACYEPQTLSLQSVFMRAKDAAGAWGPISAELIQISSTVQSGI